jgi:restriction system protein
MRRSNAIPRILVAMHRAARADAAQKARAKAQQERYESQLRKEHLKFLAAKEKQLAVEYAELRKLEAAQLNQDAEDRIASLQKILIEGLSTDSYIDLDTLKEPLELPKLNTQKFVSNFAEPKFSSFAPKPLNWLTSKLPNANTKYQQKLLKAKQLFEEEFVKYKSAEKSHKIELEKNLEERKIEIIKIRKANLEQHQLIDEFKNKLSIFEQEAVANYFGLVLDRCEYPLEIEYITKTAFVVESKQLVVEVDLPSIEIIPDMSRFRWIKTKDEIESSPRSAKECKSLYVSVISQIILRTLRDLFVADRLGAISTTVINGYVDSLDVATGKSVRPCIISLRTTRERYEDLDLKLVDPVSCLQKLNASISRAPDELIPIRPILEFNMVDPRFIQDSNILSSLNNRKNLMELTPGEFETLITNLFQSMGLETKLTRASRDGGVDCVAFDKRPILGGKVVIQAKRYKNTVGVSSVRDLYGTLQNEGASKGILVTTSGFGKASFEFAEGKPIELLSGSNLLHLLLEHTGLEAQISAPENWEDPRADIGE